MSILGQGTVVVGGQRNIAPPVAAFVPTTYGQQTTAVPNVTPIVPPYAGSSSGTSQVNNMAFASVNGVGTAENNALMTQIAANNPHHMRVSPVWWCVIFLVGGVLLLQATGWRDVIEAHGTAGPLHAGGGVSGGGGD